VPPLFLPLSGRSSLPARGRWLRLSQCVVVPLAAGLLAGAALAASRDIQGTVYPGACETKTWQALRTQIDRLAGGPAKPSPEPLLRALLCGSHAADQSALLAAAPRRIPLTSEGTGEPTVRRRVPAAQVLTPRGGDAWDATLTRVRGELQLSYRSDEACVRSVTLRLQREGWRFVRAGEGCD
jgi:hypothetical protein